MKVIFLGTGTSHGIPVIGCSCEVCTSGRRYDQRTRASIVVQLQGRNILIDAGPELRIQLIREKIKHIDALLLTHDHADHVFGIDDLRIFSERSGNPFVIYGSRPTLRSIKQRFDYAFRRTQKGGGKPNLKLIPVDQPFEIDGIRIIPLPLWHGRLKVFGYRIGQMAYMTDVSRIPETTYGLLSQLKILVLDALRPLPHPTHFSLNQAIAESEKIKARQTFFTHICHLLPHQQTNKTLPAKMKLAYDGLRIKL